MRGPDSITEGDPVERGRAPLRFWLKINRATKGHRVFQAPWHRQSELGWARTCGPGGVHERPWQRWGHSHPAEPLPPSSDDLQPTPLAGELFCPMLYPLCQPLLGYKAPGHRQPRTVGHTLVGPQRGAPPQSALCSLLPLNPTCVKTLHHPPPPAVRLQESQANPEEASTPSSKESQRQGCPRAASGASARAPRAAVPGAGIQGSGAPSA